LEEKWQFRKKLIKIYALAVTVVSIAMLTVMTTYARNKTVIINGQEIESETEKETEPVNEGAKWKYDITSSDNFDGEIIIPVPEDAGGSSFDTDIRYDRNQIVVSFAIKDDEYLRANPPYGDFDAVDEAYGEFTGERAVITFNMRETVLCETEYISRIYDGELRIRLTSLKDNDKPLVLIDAAHGGVSTGIQVGSLLEKEILLKLALQIDVLAKDRPYDVILTRSTDSYLTTEDKIAVVSATNPVLYIGLKLSSDVENVKNFGMFASYNAGFYRHGMQNVSFSDKVLRNVCENTCNKGLGLFEATEEDVILMTMDIPGTVLYAGYLSNSEEAALLGNDDYINKIATGVINALDEIYAE